MNILLKRNVGMALATMRNRRMRSFLTVLGVVIAVASVTIVVSVGRGIQTSVAEQTNEYSKNVITVRPAQIGDSVGSLTALSTATPRAAISAKDVENISNLPNVSSAVPLTIVGSEAQADDTFDGVVFAASSDLPEVLNQEIAYGAFYTSREETNNFAVLGADAADKLFDQRVPLGRSFEVRGQTYIVNGVLDKFASTPLASSTNFNGAIFISESAAESLTANGAPVYELLARVDDEKNIDKADKAITDVLSKAHGSRKDFDVLSPTELTNQSAGAFELLTQFIVVAAFITLLVSGIGIMNVMLVSVTERIHEIGVRKAVGATNRQILEQFMAEAATLSVVGSAIGALVAFVVVWLLDVFTSLTPTYDWRAAGIACAISCLFGIIFGSLPAIKAARKDPISALRAE